MLVMEQRNHQVSRTTEGWKFYPSRDFKIYRETRPDNAMLSGGCCGDHSFILSSLEVPQILETRSKLPFPQRRKSPLNCLGM